MCIRDRVLSCKTPARRRLRSKTRFQLSKNAPVMMQRGGTPVAVPAALHNVPEYSAAERPQEVGAEAFGNLVAEKFTYVIRQLNGGEKGEGFGKDCVKEENNLRLLDKKGTVLEQSKLARIQKGLYYANKFC
eukprot:TRINITY_DN4486_c0_g3_i5.p1 TRINITY_DN4486_c0_g3~~TRINITY_DN4486_c0_g3_i5.p1  ORF type:complete len:132 (+),score=17.92 TRINITY_DN4486_c0_g3_i5:81-476(+)